MKPIRELIAVAQFEKPADFAVRGAQVFNVFTRLFEQRDVLVAGGYIAAVLPHQSRLPYKTESIVDGASQWLVPGFIDAHVHIESSMVRPVELTNITAANGVTTLIADPHEIANIFGTDGVQYMLDATENALSRVFFMLPSSVPPSPLDKAARVLEASGLQPFLKHPRVLGLGEMMNYPGVLRGVPEVLEKLESIQQHNEHEPGFRYGLSMDGQASFLHGHVLQAYAAAGIRSDHGASTWEEAKERLALGMGVMLREGSAAKNLLDLVPAVTAHTAHLCMLCTDDRQLEDLVEEGSINYLVRKLVEDAQLPLNTILNMASYNTARFFSLRDIGAVAPGYRADFALYSDLATWKPEKVWRDGNCVAIHGKPVQKAENPATDRFRHSVQLQDGISLKHLQVADRKKPVKVIELVPDRIITKRKVAFLPSKDGYLCANQEKDIAKLAVFERHKKTGRVGVGFIQGIEFYRGAIASTVSHDSHNLVVAGMNDEDMLAAVRALERAGGGLAACLEGEVIALVPLPIGGLFSDRSALETYEALLEMTESIEELGFPGGYDPFTLLSFMTLPAIPSLKLTDSGLVDVDARAFTSIYAD